MFFFFFGRGDNSKQTGQNKSKMPRLENKRRPWVNDPTIDALPSAGSQTQKTSSSVLVNLAAHTARLHPTDAGFIKSPRHALLCRVILINPSTRVFTYLSRLRQIPAHGFPVKICEFGSDAVNSPAALRVFGCGSVMLRTLSRMERPV